VSQYRRQGYVSSFLGEIFKDIPVRGVQRVEAFPNRGLALDELDLSNGPEDMYI
jgi:hypothetical protein